MGQFLYRHLNPYPGKLYLWYLDSFLLNIMTIGSLTNFLSCFVWTTEELKNPLRKLLFSLVEAPLYLAFFIALFPITLTAFILWLTFQHKKLPYRCTEMIKHPPYYEKVKNTYSFATMNLCLLTECVSRFNNSSDNKTRAKEVGKRIRSKQIKVYENENASNGSVYSQSGPEKKKSVRQNGNTFKSSKSNFDHSILEEFPQTDILIIQETWDLPCAKELISEIIYSHPYIVYDAGINSWKTNRFMSNSGLMIASRYPIVDIQFDVYENSCFACDLASKGLLQIKVSLGKTSSGKHLVGYAANTHMQAYQGTKPIHTEQMNDIVRWSETFRQKSLKSNEVVIFDVLGGDFNTDNLSPVDKADWDHPIFSIYRDVGRISPGKDHPWTVGTEMRHRPLHDPRIRTPSLLKTALEDPILLQYYVLDGNMVDMKLEVAQLMPEFDSDGKQIWTEVGGRRRIDYVMTRRTENLEVLAYNAVSQLAGLTDHIPYSLTVRVPEDLLK